jgi:tetratricopeptide (TPR) repeat protein
LQTAELSLAEAAFRKQIEVNPYDEFAYNNLGRALDLQRKYDEAIEAYRKQIEINPLDRWAHANLGLLFVGRKKYADGVTELERALAITPDSAQIEVALGESYLNLGQAEKATAALDKAVEHSPTPATWNNVAYLLARKGQSLDRAQQYAESAVAAVAAELRNASLARLTLADLARVNGLAAYWDTLGWISFQRGELPKAETYVHAAWLLNQHGEVGDHLAQIYEKQGRKKESLELYARAAGAAHPVPETKTKLFSLVGDEKKLATMTSAGAEALSTQRSIKLGNLKWDAGTKDTASAEFFVALEPGASTTSPPKVADVKYISGDSALRPFAEALRAARFPDVFPDATPTQIVRRGILSCSRQTHECVFVMILPEDVRSVE